MKIAADRLEESGRVQESLSLRRRQRIRRRRPIATQPEMLFLRGPWYSEGYGDGCGDADSGEDRWWHVWFDGAHGDFRPDAREDNAEFEDLDSQRGRDAGHGDGRGDLIEYRMHVAHEEQE